MTMYGLELDTTLRQVASVLRDGVRSAAADPYARTQVDQVAELLDNLAPRLAWSSAEIGARERTERLLACLGDSGAAVLPADPGSLAGLRNAVAGAISGLYDAKRDVDVHRVVKAVLDFSVADTEREVSAALRKSLPRRSEQQ